MLHIKPIYIILVAAALALGACGDKKDSADTYTSSAADESSEKKKKSKRKTPKNLDEYLN